MIRIAHAVLLIFVVFAACESRPADDAAANREPSNAAVAPADTLDDPAAKEGEGSRQPIADLGIRLESLLDGALERDPETQELPILDRVNEPGRVSVEPVRNRHQPGQTDTLRTRHYEGVDITVYHVADGKEILQDVTVTGESIEVPDDLHFGMSRSEVESILGEADREEAAALVYEGPGPMPTRRYIHFENNAATKFEWQFPID